MRLTVNLDSESDGKLERLAQRQNSSKSQVIRDAITYYEILSREWRHIDEEAFRWYARLLGSKEHRIFDVDHMDALLAELGSPSEDLLTAWERIGREHGVQWANQFDSVEEKLRVLEYCNWYSITTLSDDQYALTTQSEQEASLVRAFLEGECDELGLEIDTRLVGQKIIVTEDPT